MRVTPLPQEGLTPTGITPPINQSAIHETAQSKAPPAVTEVPEPEKDPLSPKYAELARREKMYRSKVLAREQALKAREDALNAKESEYKTSYIPRADIPKMFQKDPYQAITDLGLTGDQLTQALLNQPSPQDLKIQQLESKLAELLGGQEKFHKTLEDTQKQNVEQALFQIKNEVKTLVASDADSFEIIKSTGSEDDVVEYIQKHFDETGILLPIDQAALTVENQLADELFKFAQLKKIQERLTPSQAQAVMSGKNPAQSVPTKQSVPSPRTLSNSRIPGVSEEMSRRERAIAMLEGRLT